MPKRVVLAYSGGLDTSVAVKWIQEEWDAEAKKQVVKDEWETVNKAAALWARSKSDVTDAEYQEFYKQISYDSQAPLAYTHNRVEGRSEYTQLLFVPAKAPFDLWNRDKKAGVKLKELVATDPGFIKWILRSEFPPDTQELMRHALEGRYPSPPAPDGERPRPASTDTLGRRDSDANAG